MEHYNASYSELKHEYNWNSEIQKYLNWSMVDMNIKYMTQVFRCKRNQLKMCYGLQDMIKMNVRIQI